MKIKTLAIDHIETRTGRYEGFRARPSLADKGNPTLGYGHLLALGETTRAITEPEARKLLSQDIRDARAATARLLRAHVNNEAADEFIAQWYRGNDGEVSPRYYYGLLDICDRCFGEPRKQSTSHRVYKTPWQGDPRVNVQNKKGMAKPCQVRQVMKALEKLAEEEDD